VNAMPPLESNPKIENTRAGIEPMTCVKNDTASSSME
jgi:hypothetical protein